MRPLHFPGTCTIGDIHEPLGVEQPLASLLLTPPKKILIPLLIRSEPPELIVPILFLTSPFSRSGAVTGLLPRRALPGDVQQPGAEQPPGHAEGDAVHLGDPQREEAARDLGERQRLCSGGQRGSGGHPVAHLPLGGGEGGQVLCAAWEERHQRL
jgi:hypothetical protein